MHPAKKKKTRRKQHYSIFLRVGVRVRKNRNKPSSCRYESESTKAQDGLIFLNLARVVSASGELLSHARSAEGAEHNQSDNLHARGRDQAEANRAVRTG